MVKRNHQLGWSLLLEGQPIHFPAPKTQCGIDICLEKDTPIFATSNYPIVYRGSYNACDDRETEIMAAHWRLFEFHRQIPDAEQKEFCAHCFSKLVMLGSDPSSLKYLQLLLLTGSISSVSKFISSAERVTNGSQHGSQHRSQHGSQHG